MTQSERLRNDVEDVVSSLRHALKTRSDMSELARHTHSLKTLALQSGFYRAADSIHRLEALLLPHPEGFDLDNSHHGIDEELRVLENAFLEEEQLPSKEDPGRESPIPLFDGPEFKDLYKMLSDEDRDHVARLLSRGYIFYCLGYQGSPGDSDILELRFQNLQSKIEKDAGVIVTYQRGNYFSLGVLAPGEQRFNQPIALVRLISQVELGYEDFLSQSAAIDLDGPSSGEDNQTVSFGVLAEELTEFANDLADTQGKRINGTIYGQIRLPVHTGDTLKGLLLQGLRNAVTHGIEDPEERRHQGKPELGVIDLCFAEMPNAVVVTLEDDGSGFLEDQKPSRTKETSSEWSGRGLGIPMIKWYGEKLLGGKVNVLSHPGSGTRVEIYLSKGLEDLWGLTGYWENEALFLPFRQIYGFLGNIGQGRPSRIGKEWFCSYRYRNFPLRSLTVHEDGTFGWDEIQVYSEEFDQNLGLLLKDRNTFGILMLSSLAGREIVARSPGNPRVFSQALKTDAIVFPF